MPTRGEEKLRSTETTRGDGSSWLWVTSMTRGLCWHDSSYIPARQGKERSDSSSSMDLLLVYHLHPPRANRPAGRAEDPARGAGDSSERSQPWWWLWVSLLVSQVAHPKSGSAHRCQSAGRQPPACAAGLGQCQRRPGRPGERWALQVSQSRPRREGRRRSESRHIKIRLLRSHIGKREKEGEQQDSRSGHKGSGTLQGCTWVQRWGAGEGEGKEPKQSFPS